MNLVVLLLYPPPAPQHPFLTVTLKPDAQTVGLKHWTFLISITVKNCWFCLGPVLRLNAQYWVLLSEAVCTHGFGQFSVFSSDLNGSWAFLRRWLIMLVRQVLDLIWFLFGIASLNLRLHLVSDLELVHLWVSGLPRVVCCFDLGPCVTWPSFESF